MAISDLPDISIRQLQYLVAVDEAPTWAAAAERVGVSPSALSQGLAELERRVGVELFAADGRRRVLRDTAAPVLDHARQVVALTADLVAWSARIRTGHGGRVRLGLIDVAAVVYFPDVLRRFRLDRPEVDLVVTVAPSATLLDALRMGDLDVAVCVDPVGAVPGVAVEPLLDEPLWVIAPPGTEVGEPSTWGPWLLFPAGSHSRALIEAELHRRGAPVAIAAESHQPDVLLQMSRVGVGWTVLPASTADAATRPVTELVSRRLVIARRADTVVDPAVDHLADLLTASSGV